jgi:hypothetical protein
MADVALEITTSSQSLNGPPFPSPQLPVILMNGNQFPQPSAPALPSGFQVAVIDPAQDITNPSSIISNQYIELWNNDGWASTYPYMYDNMIQALLTSGNVEQQLVFIVSYGMDQNAPPSTLMLQTMFDLGAGPDVQKWELNCDPGSMGPDWISYPSNYILVGTSGSGYGEGFETYVTGDPSKAVLTATLDNPAGS